MTSRLRVEVLAQRGVLVFTDPDGAEHVVRSPDEAWDLLEDLALQVQEQAAREPAPSGPNALATVEQKPRRHRSRRAAVEAERAAKRERERGEAGGESNGLARVERNEVARPAQSSEQAQEVVLTEQPQEEYGMFERGFAKVAHAVIKKSGEVSKTSRWGRGGRFSRPDGT
jgi:hypothetical protein